MLLQLHNTTKLQWIPPDLYTPLENAEEHSSPAAAYKTHEVPADGAMKAGRFKIKISFYECKFDKHQLANIFSKDITVM